MSLFHSYYFLEMSHAFLPQNYSPIEQLPISLVLLQFDFFCMAAGRPKHISLAYLLCKYADIITID